MMFYRELVVKTLYVIVKTELELQPVYTAATCNFLLKYGGILCTEMQCQAVLL